MNMDRAIGILSIVLIAIMVIFTAVVLDSLRMKRRTSSEIIRDMVTDAMFIAIIMIMTFVPNVGYIGVTPFISFTLIHLPVLLGAALFGWKKGLLLGFIFGCSSYIQALTGGVSGLNLLFAYPWTAIPPRAIFGLLAGLVFSLIRKLHKAPLKGLYLGLTAAILTAVHTTLVFLDLYVFFPDTIGSLFLSTDPAGTGTALTFTLLILVGMAGEMGLAAFVTPLLTIAVSKAVPSIRKRESTRA